MTITLDPTWVADVSMDAYSVTSIENGTSATCISTTRYSRYLSRIEKRLIKDGLLDASGNIKSGYEDMAALLVCDLIQSGPITDMGIKSEDFGGDYSYTKSESAASSIKSAFMMKYEAELASTVSRGVYASSGTVRRDYEIEFAKLSQGTPSRVEDSSDNYPTV